MFYKSSWNVFCIGLDRYRTNFRICNSDSFPLENLFWLLFPHFQLDQEEAIRNRAELWLWVQQEMGWLAKHGRTRDDSKNGAAKKAGRLCDCPASGVFHAEWPSDQQPLHHYPATPFLAPKSKRVWGGKQRKPAGVWRRTPSQTRPSLSNSYWRLYAWLHSRTDTNTGRCSNRRGYRYISTSECAS